VDPNAIVKIGIVAATALFGGFAGAVKWLDVRRECDTREGRDKIATMERNNKRAVQLLVEAIQECAVNPENKVLQSLLKAAVEALS